MTSKVDEQTEVTTDAQRIEEIKEQIEVLKNLDPKKVVAITIAVVTLQNDEDYHMEKDAKSMNITITRSTIGSEMHVARIVQHYIEDHGQALLKLAMYEQMGLLKMTDTSEKSDNKEDKKEDNQNLDNLISLAAENVAKGTTKH